MNPQNTPTNHTRPIQQNTIQPPPEWSDKHPCFRLPSWGEIDFGEMNDPEFGSPADESETAEPVRWVMPTDASRHFFITGETGSGKTKSAVMPLIFAAYEYPTRSAYDAYVERATVNQGRKHVVDNRDELRPSILVIDPKNELSNYLFALQEEFLRMPENQGDKNPVKREIVQLNGRGARRMMWLFEGLDLAIHQDRINPAAASDKKRKSPGSDILEKENGDKICKQILSRSQSYQNQFEKTNDAFWPESIRVLLESLIKIDYFISCREGVAGLQMFWEEISAQIKGSIRSAFPDDEETVAALPDLAYTPENYLLPHYQMINLWSRYHTDSGNLVIEAHLRVCRDKIVPVGLLQPFQTYSKSAISTLTSIVMVANNVLSELTNESLANLISFNPYEAPDAEHYLSIREVMERGDCVIYTPLDESDVQTMIGKILKSKFFEFTFKRHNPIRPFFYICDEFQRFITSDKDSGEQSYLDRCRAYRAVCVLSTQSISSLEYALNESGKGSTVSPALNVILTNTGNKLFFRNSDQHTQSILRNFIAAPFISGHPALTEVRPVTTLVAGECYYFTSNGRQGRGQVDLYQDPFYDKGYKAYKDRSIENAFQEFSRFKNTVEKQLAESGYIAAFSEQRGYQQIRHQDWPGDPNTLDIHFEINLSFRDFQVIKSDVNLELHVEGPQNFDFHHTYLGTSSKARASLRGQTRRIVTLGHTTFTTRATGRGSADEFMKQFKTFSQEYAPIIAATLEKLRERKKIA